MLTDFKTTNRSALLCREKRIAYACRLLDHANISTRYMHLDERELAEAQDLMEQV